MKQITLCIGMLLFSIGVFAKGSMGKSVMITPKVFYKSITGNATSQCTGCSYSAVSNFAGGVTVDLGLGSSGFAIRSGGLYSTRNISLSIIGVTLDYKYSYVDIPIILKYSFNDIFSIYAGAIYGSKLSSTYPAGTTGLTDKSSITPITAGLNLYIAQHVSLELAYESVSDLTSFAASGALPAGTLQAASTVSVGLGYAF